MMVSVFIRSLAAICLLSGCAGPTTPFGAVNISSLWKSLDPDRDTASLEDEGVRIRFSPDRQVLHGKSPFTVIIDDPQGVPDDFRFRLSYNGIDISQKFLSRAERVYDPSRRQLRLVTKTLRLQVEKENQIRASYWRDENSRSANSPFMPPICSAFLTSHPITTTPGFNTPRRMIAFINEHAVDRSLNPHLVAGLIAQESGFDPRAVSQAKALGLTQITSLGEAELLKGSVLDWPRYPGLSDMPLPILKLAINNGEINSKNEWRLDPALSIVGGVEYLSYLNSYWSRDDKRALLERSLGLTEKSLGEVLLASYNSGAARVAQAIERKGTSWLDDEELSEARKYVRKVVSYCDYFSNEED